MNFAAAVVVTVATGLSAHAATVDTGIDTFISSRQPDGIGNGGGCCGNNVPTGQPRSGEVV